MIKNVFFVLFSTVILTGCPQEDSESQCEKVMECQQDSEMTCEKRENSCGEDCHYYVIEHCYEVCKE